MHSAHSTAYGPRGPPQGLHKLFSTCSEAFLFPGAFTQAEITLRTHTASCSRNDEPYYSNEHYSPWGLLNHCHKNYMDCPVWYRNTFISAPRDSLGPNKSIKEIFNPIHDERDGRWLKNLGMTTTGKQLRTRVPPTRKNIRGRLILSEPSPLNERRPPRGAAGHCGPLSSVQRAPTGQAMTGKGTAISVDTTEMAPLGNVSQEAFTTAGAKKEDGGPRRQWLSAETTVSFQSRKAQDC